MHAILLAAFLLLPVSAFASEHCRKGGSVADCRKEVAGVLAGLHDQLPESFELMHEACLDAGDDFSCAVQASWVRRGADPKYANPGTFFNSDRLTRLEKECAARDPLSCYAAGLALEKGLGVPRAYEAGNKLQDRACDLGYLRGCRGTKVACDKGDPTACAGYGFNLIQDGPLPAKYPEAFEVFKKACNGGSALGCNSFAWMHEFGYGVEKDVTQAEVLFFKACRMNNGQACLNFGMRILNFHAGLPEKERFEKGFDLFSRSCNFGWGAGCRELARMYASGKGAIRSLETAVSLLRRGCDLDDAQSCSILAEYARRGKGMDRSEELAQLFDGKSKAKEMVKVIEGRD